MINIKKEKSKISDLEIFSKLIEIENKINEIGNMIYNDIMEKKILKTKELKEDIKKIKKQKTNIEAKIDGE